MKSLRVRGFRAFRPVLAAVAAVVLGLGAAGVGPAASAAAGQTVSASLAKPVVAASCSGTPQVCSVGVAEGATGFPVSVSITGVTGAEGAVPAGDWVSVSAGGAAVGGSWASGHGGFAGIGGVSTGQVATISWAAAEGVSGQGTGAEQVTNGATVVAAGLTSGTYTLVGSTTAWAASVSLNDNGDLSAITGGYTAATKTTYAFMVTSVAGGAATAVEYAINGGAWSAPQTLSSGDLTVAGVTFIFGGTSALDTDQVDVTLSPQETVYALSSLSRAVYGAVAGGQSVTLANSGNTAALSFETNQTTPSLSQTLGVYGTNTAVTTAEPAWTPVEATLTVS